MNRIRLPLTLALGLLLSTACAPRATQEPEVQGPDFILEIHNPMPHAMNVRFSLGGSLTTLGTINANETRRWSIPNRGGDTIRLVASDEGNTHTADTSLDLEGGAVRRWEIR